MRILQFIVAMAWPTYIGNTHDRWRVEQKPDWWGQGNSITKECRGPLRILTLARLPPRTLHTWRESVTTLTCWGRRSRKRSVSWRASWGPPQGHCRGSRPPCRRASPRWRNPWWARGRCASRGNPAPTGSCGGKWGVPWWDAFDKMRAELKSTGESSPTSISRQNIWKQKVTKIYVRYACRQFGETVQVSYFYKLYWNGRREFRW